MSIKKIQITDIADFDSVEVIEVLVKKGDEVDIDQPVVTVESDKAMMDYPSPFAGTIEEVYVREGNKVSEGDVLLTLHAKEAINQSEKVSTPKKLESEIEAKSSTAKENTSNIKHQQLFPSNSYASPGTHKYARELGVNLNDVQGSARGQRVVIEDVQQHVQGKLQATNINSFATKGLDFSSYGETHDQVLNSVQKRTAKNMQHAWQSIPHVTHFDEADVTLLEQHRKKLANQYKQKNIKLTPLAFVIKALVVALKKYPQFNSSLDITSEKIIYKNYFHIGIAVDTEYGLFVPVIRDVDKKSLEQVAIELVEISHLARQRKLKSTHMGGASMTLSSLGNLGGRAFTPIINPPEVAILGLSKMIIKEKVLGSDVKQQKLLPLSLSYDHRVINGADAARFCTYLKNVLEDIWKLIL